MGAGHGRRRAPRRRAASRTRSASSAASGSATSPRSPVRGAGGECAIADACGSLCRPLHARPARSASVKAMDRASTSSGDLVLGAESRARGGPAGGLRRRHRPQRHPHRRPAARAQPQPGDDPGRGPLSHRPRRLPRPARRRGLAGALPAAAARLLVEGLSDAADARAVPRSSSASASTPRSPASNRGSPTIHEDACRRLFYELLEFRTGPGRMVRGIVEQSCDTVAQAPTLVRAVPAKARFVHVVRDGRDASASRVAQTRGLIRPRTREAGIELVGGADHPRSRPAPTRSPPERLLTVSLDELLLADSAQRPAAAASLLRHQGEQQGPLLPPRADESRPRPTSSAGARASRSVARNGSTAVYEEALERLEAAGRPLGAAAAPDPGALARRRAAPLPYVYDPAPR